MDTRHLRMLLDACFTAKHVIETLPELPEGIKPRHIHVLDAIQELSEQKGTCKVSDVSSRMNITTPSISKLISELVKMNYIEKETDVQDRRVCYLILTERGKECVRTYVTDFHNTWVRALDHIDNEEVVKTVKIIQDLNQTIPGGK